MSKDHRPPYVTRQVVYTIRDYECGHCSSKVGAYEEIARQMWWDAEPAGRVPKLPRTSDDDSYLAWELHHGRTTQRLARWLAWVDSKQQTGSD